MPQADCTFLSGSELSSAIRNVCGAGDVDCAVAFWGIGMRETLFPQWSEGVKIRVICDISQGATCRAALRQLGAPDNKRLRVADAFHGKVYISSRGAVIGSPNASGNGVGLCSDRGGRLLETGVFCPPGTAAYRNARKWFRTFYKSLDHVDEEALASARERSDELHARARPEVMARLSLLQRLVQYPQNFRGVRIAVATGQLDPQKAEASMAERAAARPDMATQPIDAVILQNDGDLDFKPFAGPVLLLWRPRSLTRVSGFLECSTWPPGTPDTVFGVDEWIAFWKKFRQPAPLRRLSDEESETIGRFLELDGERWLFSPEEFVERIGRLT